MGPTRAFSLGVPHGLAYKPDSGVTNILGSLEQLAVYHPQSSEAQRELEMAPKRRRSERGPISLAVRALLELPDTIVAEILRLVDTGRYLEWDGLGGVNPWIYKRWSGTHRMVNFNRSRMYSVKWSNRPSWIELLPSLTGP